MTPLDQALDAPAPHVRLDGDVPVIGLPETLSVEQLKQWLAEVVSENVGLLGGQTCRIDLGQRRFELLEARRIISYCKTELELDVTALYLRPAEVHRFAERQARVRLIPVPEVLDDTTEVTLREVEDVAEIEEVDVAEAFSIEEDAAEEEEGSLTLAALPEDPRARRTLHIHRTLRSGTALHFDGDVVLVGDVNPGAEIVCAGHVHVWGACKGLVHAGAKGDETCRVMALDLRPTQIRIGRRIALLEARTEPAGLPEIARVDEGRIRIEPFRARVR